MCVTPVNFSSSNAALNNNGESNLAVAFHEEEPYTGISTPQESDINGDVEDNNEVQNSNSSVDPNIYNEPLVVSQELVVRQQRLERRCHTRLPRQLQGQVVTSIWGKSKCLTPEALVHGAFVKKCSIHCRFNASMRRCVELIEENNSIVVFTMQ